MYVCVGGWVGGRVGIGVWVYGWGVESFEIPRLVTSVCECGVCACVCGGACVGVCVGGKAL